jgi:hypothetical protein
MPDEVIILFFLQLHKSVRHTDHTVRLDYATPQ